MLLSNLRLLLILLMWLSLNPSCKKKDKPLDANELPSLSTGLIKGIPSTNKYDGYFFIYDDGFGTAREFFACFSSPPAILRQAINIHLRKISPNHPGNMSAGDIVFNSERIKSYEIAGPSLHYFNRWFASAGSTNPQSGLADQVTIEISNGPFNYVSQEFDHPFPVIDTAIREINIGKDYTYDVEFDTMFKDYDSAWTYFWKSHYRGGSSVGQKRNYSKNQPPGLLVLNEASLVRDADSERPFPFHIQASNFFHRYFDGRLIVFEFNVNRRIKVNAD